jgi:hypothetical protein
MKLLHICCQWPADCSLLLVGDTSFLFVLLCCITHCIHLHDQTVDVSYNAIADLTPLAALPFLQELNASHNSITDVLAYKVLQGKDFRSVLGANMPSKLLYSQLS